MVDVLSRSYDRYNTTCSNDRLPRMSLDGHNTYRHKDIFDVKEQESF